jgi:antitoxin component of MazEF toxin-antitoxin module
MLSYQLLFFLGMAFTAYADGSLRGKTVAKGHGSDDIKAIATFMLDAQDSKVELFVDNDQITVAYVARKEVADQLNELFHEIEHEDDFPVLLYQKLSNSTNREAVPTQLVNATDKIKQVKKAYQPKATTEKNSPLHDDEAIDDGKEENGDGLDDTDKGGRLLSPRPSNYWWRRYYCSTSGRDGTFSPSDGEMIQHDCKCYTRLGDEDVFGIVIAFRLSANVHVYGGSTDLEVTSCDERFSSRPDCSTRTRTVHEGYTGGIKRIGAAIDHMVTASSNGDDTRYHFALYGVNQYRTCRGRLGSVCRTCQNTNF